MSPAVRGLLGVVGGIGTTYTAPVFDPPPGEGTDPPTPPGPVDNEYILMSVAELMALPTSGSAYTYLRSIANSTWPAPEYDDQDSRVNTMALAAALVYARTGENAYRTKVRNAIAAVIPTYDYSQDAGLGPLRQTAGWVLAADFINLAALDSTLNTSFRAFLLRALTSKIGTHSRWGLSIRNTHGDSDNNWGGWAGGARIAADLYLGGQTADLAIAWNVYQGFLGDRTKWSQFKGQIDTSISAGAKTWALPQPYAKTTYTPTSRATSDPRVGAFASDISRMDSPGAPGGNYPTVGTHGLMYQSETTAGMVLQAELLYRNGYPSAWTVVSNGIAKIATFDVAKGAWNLGTVQFHVPWLINKRLSTAYATQPAQFGRSFGFTDWLYAP